MAERRALLEVCVDTLAGAAIAAKAGADRLEICAVRSDGGVTPSPAMMQAVAALPVPVYALIRPRAGDFRFSAAEVAVMQGDVRAARDAGLAGVVIGASDATGALDLPVLRDLIAAAAPLPVALHRAFDVAPDMDAALEQAIDLGLERVLTSGGRPGAYEGADTIARLVARAGDRISVMAGGGLRPDTLAAFVARTGVREIHGSCSAPIPAADKRAVELGFEHADGRLDTHADVVRAMLAALGEQGEAAA